MGKIGDGVEMGCLSLRFALFVIFMLFALMAVLVTFPILLLIFLMIPFLFL